MRKAALIPLLALAGPAAAHDVWADGSPVPAWVKSSCCGPAAHHACRSGRDCASVATRLNASARRGAARSTGWSQARRGLWRPEAMGEAQSRQPVETPAAQTLEAELDRIRGLGLDEVRALWREMTQQNAPKALSRDLLARMIAYRVQEQRPITSSSPS